MTDQTQTASKSNGKSRPTHVVRKKIGHGRKADFETIGMAWDRGDGSVYVKAYGTQIIKGGFYVFPIKDQEEDA
ncbi:MAG: hypothetical protein KME37_09710 [Candidatus Thiodiazotropha sp. (ex Codakia orbicularis)]|nr:hypothetical protein [Candidatus Thiodiazotropha sp. (ex Codakia orbicularis)]